MTEITDIIDKKTLVLVEFYTNWCSSCKVLNPYISQLQETYQEKVKVVKVDVDKYHRVADKLKVLGVPTIMMFDKGKEVWRNAGVHSIAQIEHMIMKYSA